MLPLRAWNLMGGEINWVALPIIAELYGITDLDAFIAQVAEIRDWHKRNQETE